MYRRAASTSISPLRVLIACAVLQLNAVHDGYGQTRHYATGAVTGNRERVGNIVGLGYSPGLSGISNPPMTPHTTLLTFRFFYNDNYLNFTQNAPATLTASRTVGASLLGVNLLSLAGGHTYIQFRYPGPVSAGTTTFVRLGSPPTSSGLSVPLGGLLSLGDNRTVFGTLYRNAGTPVTGDDVPIIGTPSDEKPGSALEGNHETEILIDKAGVWYAAITSSSGEQYNSVRLKLQIPEDILGLNVVNQTTLHAYNAFYITPGSELCNSSPLFVSQGEVDGIQLNLNELNLLNLGDLIINPHFAIDDSETTAAVLKGGLVGVGVFNTVAQSYYFDRIATPTDGVRFKLGVPTDLIELSLLAGITLRFYNGDVLVGSQSLNQNLIGINLLNLPILGDGNRLIETIVKPNLSGNYNKVKLEINGNILNLSVLGSGLHIYNVSISPSSPQIDAPNGQPKDVIVCESEIAHFSVSATVPLPGSITDYEWQYFDGENWVTAPAVYNQATYDINDTQLSDNGRKYRVRITGGRDGCLQTIYSNEVTLTVLAQPGKPHLTITEVNN